MAFDLGSSLSSSLGNLGTSIKTVKSVTGNILDNSQNTQSAIKSVATAQSAISSASATGALSAIGGIAGTAFPTTAINIPTPTIAEGIPSAGSMLSVARAVEKAATELKETAIYNAYVDVFDTIKLIAQSGNYSYELELTPQQQAELTPLLAKYGYSTNLIKSYNSTNYVSISWGTSSISTVSTPTFVQKRGTAVTGGGLY